MPTNYLTNDTELSSVANAIRTKGGTSADLVYPDGFVSAIGAISSGGIPGGYNVTFKDGDDDVYYVSVPQGSSISAPPAPTKTGYTFGGWGVSFPYTPVADVTLTAVWSAIVKCTVANLGSSSPSSVSFTKDSGFTKTGLGIEDVTVAGDTFVKIPTMYRKINAISSNQITSFTIANGQLDNTYEPYSCFIDENNNLLPYVLIGKYWNTTETGCVSTTEGSAAKVITSVGRGSATSRGTGYQMFDWQLYQVWRDLIICFKETVNTNSGSGIPYDEIGIYWDANDGWIDGVIGANGAWKTCAKPSKYASLSNTTDSIPSDYVSIGYSQPTTDGEIQKLGYDSNNPFFNFPNAVISNNNYNTYYCDIYYVNPDNRPVFIRCGAPNASYGVFACDVSGNWSTLKMGVRLCYRPIAS